MPIFLFLGKPRAGKSYEAVVHHILPAVLKGRKVITNIPLHLDQFEKIYPASRAYLEVKSWDEGQHKPFSVLLHYHSDWRHPTDNYGPLLVIDECHEVLPRSGTSRDIEEWFARHGHGYVDVILITQDHRKINLAIKNMAEKIIICRNNRNIGLQSSYRYAEYDAVGQKVPLFSAVRSYDKKFFPLYTSFTQAQGKTGIEIGTGVSRPVWARWQLFCGVGLLIASGSYFFFSGASIFPQNREPTKIVRFPEASTSAPVSPPPAASAGAVTSVTPPAAKTPPVLDLTKPRVLMRFRGVWLVEIDGEQLELHPDRPPVLSADSCSVTFDYAGDAQTARLPRC